ncbi:MAG: DMT family transporter, partial [Eubacterium sp.]|nr:DMT family transporter [Eubacterium sp.]
MNNNQTAGKISSMKARHSFLLVLAALGWGTTFVAQSKAMNILEPYSYNACRYLLGVLVLLPLAILAGRIDPHSVNYRGEPIPNVTESLKVRKRNLLIGGLLCGVFLFLASGTQQIGLLYTSASKCGFVTSLYIIMVPIISLFFRKKCSPLIIAALGIAVLGFYMLCINEGFSVNIGDAFTLVSSLMFALQIMVIDRFGPRVAGLQLSVSQFLVCGVLSAITAVVTEHPTWDAILSCWGPILYAAIFSCGVGYTLQIIGQRGL